MVSKIETKISLDWAEQNPEMFIKAIRDFRDKYKGKEWKVSATFQRGALFVLCAERVTAHP